MEFEEMRKIWDDQNKQHLFLIDEKTLHKRIAKDKDRIKRMVGYFEWVVFFTLLALAIMMLAEGWLDNELYQLPEGILVLFSAGFIYWDRLNRLKKQGASDNTILADINQSIFTIDYQIRRQRYFAWWFTSPLILAMIIHFIFTYQGKPWWLWVLALCFFIYQHWLLKKEIRCKYQPRRDNLESLRNLLLEK